MSRVLCNEQTEEDRTSFTIQNSIVMINGRYVIPLDMSLRNQLLQQCDDNAGRSAN